MIISSNDYAVFEAWDKRPIRELLQFMAYLDDQRSKTAIQI